MSSRSIILTLVVLIIIVAGGWYVISYGNSGYPSSGSDMATTTTTSTTTTPSSGTQATTLRALTAQGGNYTCSIDTITSNGETTGTVYGAGGKTRLEFIVAQNGLNITTHIIRSGTISYTWVDGQQVGIKSTITPTSPITPGQGGVISVSDTSNVSSTCHPWIPDASQFVPPKGITFRAQ